METSPKNFHFCDDSKQYVGSDPLPHLGQNSDMVELCEERPEESAEGTIQLKYYREFKKIYFTSYKLWTEIHKQAKAKEAIATRISHLESQLVGLHRIRRNQEVEEEVDEGEVSSRRKNLKRTRRTAEEIQRKHYCQANFCDRVYGSEGSLQQHIKLKHPELYRGEQEQEL